MKAVLTRMAVKHGRRMLCAGAAALLTSALMGTQAQEQRPIQVFIVAGQSNAQGYNHVRQYRQGREAFPADLRVQPRILFWLGSDIPKANDDRWTTLRVGDTGAFGPEIGFAHALEQMMPGATIAVVKYAVGGSGIARSEAYTDYIPALAGFDDKGRNWHPPTDGREAGALYGGLIASVRNAMQALGHDGKKWELAGFLWMQGEHEAGISRKMAEDYARLLSDFIKSVRKDLEVPALPFAIGQVNSHTWAYGDIARNCQAAVCQNDPRTLLVETVDLPRVSGDAAHFTADGMLTLGFRFAKAMAALLAARDGRVSTESVSKIGTPDLVLEPGKSLVFAKPGDGARTYARTARGDFVERSFQAEVTVTLKGGAGAGCAFFGMGCGRANARQYQEPSTAPSIFVRLAPSDFSGGMVTATVNGHETDHGSAPVGDGTHRVRFTWDATGKRALFEIDAQWDGQSFQTDSSVTVSAAEVDFGSDARLFVGGANGVEFSGLSTKPLTDAALKVAGFGESFANDPTARTWLPVGTPVVPPVPEVDELLKSLHGHVRLLGCWYAGSKLAASRPFASGELARPSTKWNCNVRTQPVVGDKDALDMTVTFKLTEGTTTNAGAAVTFDIADWSTNNYVLIPASVYNGNRNRIENRGYCTGFDAADFYDKDLTVTHGDVPRLALQPGQPSKIEVSACNASTPAICFFNRETKRAFIVLAEQGIHSENGATTDHGFMVEESADRTHATLVVSAPGVRERKPEFIGFGSSPDRGRDWKAGDQATLRLRVYVYETPDIPGLLDKFMTVRKAVTGPNHPRNLIPFSEVIRLMTGRTDSRWHDGTVHNYYCPENSDQLCLGWIGGLINTFPMLSLGDEMHRERVLKTFDFVIPAAQGKSGYFLATVHADGKASGRDWFPNQPIVLTRQDADVLYWMIKQLLLLQAQGHADDIKPAWEQSVKQLAQAFVNTWQRHGQWGNYLNHETGDIAIYNSTSGAMAIGGLALAAEWFKQPEFLRVAREAADYYYQHDFVQKGFTFGACSDIMQNADSETASALMTSLMALYEVTGDPQWLEKSRQLANLLATWVVSYDYELPKNTELSQLGAKLAGVVWASTQNKHGAPGICTSSGDPLFKIYRATGDRRYAELMRDIVHAHAEGIKPGGEITERLTYCDADSRGSRGGGSTGWCELNGLLMALELPGIYLRTDEDECFVFDSVEARVLKRDGDGVTLEIHNPTRYNASVTVLAEDAKQSKQPLGCTAFRKWPRIEVKAGETRAVRIKAFSVAS